jgi:hypothetical protein
MTLKEKFENNIIGVIGEIAIADEFAIGFAEWVGKLSHSQKSSVWSKDGKNRGMFAMDNEQLLEIYKKKQGLSN